MGNRHKKNKTKSLELPFFVSFSDNTTSEERAQYWRLYQKQRTELKKNRKFSRQHKGVRRPYKVHRIIQNLVDSAY